MHLDVSLLRSVAILNLLDQSAVDALQEKSEIVRFEPGDIILREGDIADAAWVMLEGSVQIYKERLGGDHLFLHVIGAGEIFGEQALITGNRRNASARAQTSVVALRLPEMDFLTAMGSNVAVREKFALLGTKQIHENLTRESALLKSLKLDGGPSTSARERVVADGEVLFREGDEAHHVYVIFAGKAAVYQHKDGAQTLLTKLTQGQTVGELGLIRRAPRAATVIAEGTLRLYEIDASYFYALYESSEGLRNHFQVLERVYVLPRRGFMTQYTGRYLDREALNTLYDLNDGTRLIVSNVTGEILSNLERLPVGNAVTDHLEQVRFFDEARGIQRELRLDAKGHVYGVTAFGEWLELPEIYALAMDGGTLDSARMDTFRRTGSIGKSREPSAPWLDDKVVCQCVNVKRRTLQTAIMAGVDELAALQKATGCGTVCGGCIPVVKELLGSPGSVPAKVIEEIPVCDGIRTFRLEPLKGVAEPSLPGQHVVLEAEIDGSWVRRPYTLSSPTRDGCYEVTIKRESQGQFSRWMFDERHVDMSLRVSAPQGKYFWRVEESPVVCLVAGIGVTPALAVCRAVIDKGLETRLHIDYSAQSILDFAYPSELTDAAEKFPNITVNLRATSLQPRLDLSELQKLKAELPDAVYFLCGPQSYLDSITALLTAAGVADDRVRKEIFVHVGGEPRGEATRKPVDIGRRKRSGEPDLSLLFADPKPGLPPKAPHWFIRFMANLGGQYNFELIFAGKRISPLGCLIDLLESRFAGVDPHLPSEHLAPFKGAVLGGMSSILDAFNGLDSTVSPNRERARKALKDGSPLPSNTPDGLTYTFSIKSFDFSQFEGMKSRVDTGWLRTSTMPATAVYVTRSPTAAHTLLCVSKNVDRGPVPYHYWQQFAGYTGRSPRSQCKPGGLVVGQYHDNKSWEDDRKVVVNLAGLAALNERTLGITEVINDICDDEIDLFIQRYPEKSFDAGVLMGQIAFRVVLFTSFPGVDEALLDRLGTNFARIALQSMRLIGRLIRLDLSVMQRFVESVPQIRSAVADIAEAVRDAHARGELSEEQLNSTLNHHIIFGANGQSPNNDELVPLLAGFLIAGHETTGRSLTWALYELGRNPQLYDAVKKEVSAFNASHDGRTMTSDDYDERPVTLAFMYELMRLHPVFPFSIRSASSKGTVPPDPETGIGGFDYPADAVLTVALFAINLNPETFPHPHEMRIERFFHGITPDMTLKEQGARVRKNASDLETKFRYLTFGAGPAGCPGRNFNMLEFFLVIDALMKRYEFQLVDPNRVVVTTEDAAIVGPMPGEVAVRIRHS